jgi:hypothetical protein
MTGPQTLLLYFYLGTCGGHTCWAGKDRQTSLPAVECACGWTVVGIPWEDVRAAGHAHLNRTQIRSIRAPWAEVTG